VHDLLVKIHPADGDKIELIKQLVAGHLDIDRIYARFAAPGEVAAGRAGRASRAGSSGRPRSVLSRVLAGLRRPGRPAPGSR